MTVPGDRERGREFLTLDWFGISKRSVGWTKGVNAMQTVGIKRRLARLNTMILLNLSLGFRAQKKRHMLKCMLGR
jgi:hypothetical protein